MQSENVSDVYTETVLDRETPRFFDPATAQGSKSKVAMETDFKPRWWPVTAENPFLPRKPR